MVKRIITLLLFSVFIFSGRGNLDPDFGWHLRMGEIISERGIPKTDPFSYTMPSYPFVDHEWLTNFLISMTYPKIGLEGLTVFFVALALTALYIQASVVKSKWALLPFALSGFSLIPFLGIRPQIISWVLFSILVTVLLNEKYLARFRLVLPLFFLIWANLHPGFGLGLVVFLVTLVIDFIQRKKRLLGNILIFASSVCATFVNPYSWRIWWEIFMQMSDSSSLRSNISEWKPAIFTWNYEFILLLPLSAIFIFMYRNKFGQKAVVLYFFLLAFGLSSVRQLPFWLIMTIPIVAKGTEFFYKNVLRDSISRKRFISSYKALCLLAVIIICVHTFSIFAVKISSKSYYPNESIKYLKNNPTKGNLFSEYNWGGYLIWQYPEKKVFIDGRMPSFRREHAPLGESKNAFSEYQKIIKGDKDTESLFKKYEIDTVLIANSREKSSSASKLIEFIEMVFGKDPKEQGSLKEELEKMKMKAVYKEDCCVIYRKTE